MIKITFEDLTIDLTIDTQLSIVRTSPYPATSNQLMVWRGSTLKVTIQYYNHT